MSSQGDPPAVPERVGHFHIEAPLGRGGMGVVYRARDEHLDRIVALKLIADERVGDEHRRRFLREARSAAQVTHPHIATVYEAGEADGRAFIAMELVEGESLRQRLDRGKLALEEAIRLARQVAAGLAAAHAVGIVHRDLKPENVMINAQGDAKILDFGLAKLRHVAPVESLTVAEAQEARREDVESASTATMELTLEGSVVGTPGYMAPEQARGEAVDARADLFSLGVLIYETLCGVTPFPGETVVDRLTATIRDEPPSLEELRPGVPKRLVALVERCLVKEVSRRLEQATLVESALAAIEQAGSDATVSTGAVVAAAPRSHRVPLFVAAALVVALIAVGWGYWSREEEKRAAAVAPSTPPAAAPSVDDGLAAFGPFPDTKPEARRAYLEAIRSERDGGDYARAWARVLELDPNLTGAHARLARWYHASGILEEAREHHRLAQRPGGNATPFERAIVRCLEPLVQRQPSDFVVHGRCMSEVVASFPNNPEAHVWQGVSLLMQGEKEERDAARKHFRRAVELAPRYAAAVNFLAQCELYEGHFDASAELLNRAIELTPTSVRAWRYRLRLQATQGDCARMLKSARRLVAVASDYPRSHILLAEALAAQRAPRAGVEEALARAESLLDGTDGVERQARPSVLGRRVRLAMLHGDFAVAEEGARELEARAENSNRLEPHAWPARLLVQIYTETGRPELAADVAEDFLDRRGAWERDPRSEDFAVAKDAVPFMWRAMRRAERLPAEKLEERRRAWLEDWQRRATSVLVSWPGYLWLRGYSDVVHGEADARAALGALKTLGPIPPWRPFMFSETGVGRTFLMSGRVAEARTWLGRATAHCNILAFPYESTRAYLFAGRAAEADGDTEQACAAYASLLERWGEASPASVSAAAARSRREELGCGG